jgi:predicted permease
LVSGGTESLSLDLHPDLRVFGFTLAVSLLSGILFGLIPALQVTSIDIGQVVQANSRNQRGSRPKQRLTMGLLISQVAISLCLLAGAGLLMRTLQNLKNQDIGVDRNKVLALSVLADPMSIKSTQLIHLRTQTIERLRAIPDVLSVSCSEFSLFGGSMSTAPVRVPDSNVNPEKDEEVRENWVSADYFQTVGMKLRLGRAFTERDTEAAPKVAVINETLSRRYFAHKSPIGKTIYFPKVDAQGRYIPFGPQLEKAQPVQVVGVIQDAKYDDLRESTPGMAFFPIDQTAAGMEGFPTSIEVRTSLNPSAAAPKIRQILKQVNPNLILRSMTTLEDQIDATLVQERLLAKLLGFFGALALVLACVGLYGIMSYSVARRTGEIGIRMALGAQQADVLKIVLREGMLPVTIGVGAGVAAALALTRFLESILYRVRPTDPTTFMLVSLVLIGVALLACYIPARRATKVDPMVALRYE